MIGPLFTINASNIGHAAIAAASRPIPQDEPVTIKLATHAASGDNELYVEVRSMGGFARDIRIGEGEVGSILAIREYDACREACQAFIDDRAEHVRTAVLDAQAHSDRFVDSHMDVSSGPHIMGPTDPES